MDWSKSTVGQRPPKTGAAATGGVYTVYLLVDSTIEARYPVAPQVWMIVSDQDDTGRADSTVTTTSPMLPNLAVALFNVVSTIMALAEGDHSIANIVIAAGQLIAQWAPLTRRQQR